MMTTYLRDDDDDDDDDDDGGGGGDYDYDDAVNDGCGDDEDGGYV